MVRDYISRVRYIQALQYDGNNSDEVQLWLGSYRCSITGKVLRIFTPSSIKLEEGDYIIKENNHISVLTESNFNEQYQHLLVSPMDCLQMSV